MEWPKHNCLGIVFYRVKLLDVQQVKSAGVIRQVLKLQPEFQSVNCHMAEKVSVVNKVLIQCEQRHVVCGIFHFDQITVKN